VQSAGVVFLHNEYWLVPGTSPLRNRRWFRGLREIALISIVCMSHGGISRSSLQRWLVSHMLAGSAPCCVLVIVEHI
jgi:hypothetical protein